MKARKGLAVFIALGTLSSCANADEARADSNVQLTAANKVAASPASPTSPGAALFNIAGDRSLIKLSGTVASTKPNSFMLKSGNELITVEMDDWDAFQEGRELKAGDQVVVTGRVDQDAWERKKIEASSVYVRNLGVTFQANGADEEDLAAALLLVDNSTATIGKVSAVEGSELTVGSANGSVRVDLSKLAIRPVIKVGDLVHAWGAIDVDPNERPELKANGITVLTQDKTKTLSQS